ncbi:hypothetical protein CANCADRAFT_78723 [Tortispora caseinolytica NRRL Y-17796]|uniref:PIH1 N-terminal domain-containing protein n=1 Tax=Tortispora caseinolytica NRRL Y-17796 TaxID=767744 RepID=A0A1E4TJL0_9ASCO|nr:hypothetical protein CANCADRAFT_78723 [Tortispora caseinolytica NRRL Y-17796]
MSTPIPSFVVKTLILSDADSRYKGEKVFVNICRHPSIPLSHEFTSFSEMLASVPPDQVQLPLMLSSERSDKDHAGNPCYVWDAILNPKVIREAVNDPPLRHIVVELVLSCLEESVKLSLSREWVVPRMLSKGTIAPLNLEISRPQPAADAASLSVNTDIKASSLGSSDSSSKSSRSSLSQAAGSLIRLEPESDHESDPSPVREPTRPLVLEIRSAEMDDQVQMTVTEYLGSAHRFSHRVDIWAQNRPLPPKGSITVAGSSVTYQDDEGRFGDTILSKPPKNYVCYYAKDTQTYSLFVSTD